MLEPGTLGTKVRQRSEHALRCGALRPISTQYEFIEQEGISFLVRILSNLDRKDEARKQQKTASPGKEFNPFRPYDKDLFVADLSDTHVCLLNKFNVLEHHLLIVTRAFEDQESLLNLRDFQALWTCMAEIEGLAFYNAGEISGASQRHKHLQIVPLPLAPAGPAIPIEPALTSVRFEDSFGIVPGFPFLHAFIQWDSDRLRSPSAAAKTTLEYYQAMLQRMQLWDGARANETRRIGSYNLLATRQWMLMVPRSQECFQGISINALGFAGALLVRNERQKQLLRDYGPMTALRNVAVSTTDTPLT